jgi:hypothetical protein
MPRRLPPHVEKNVVKGHVYLSFRRGKGARIRLPPDPNSAEFKAAYAAALAVNVHRKGPKRDDPGTIGALIESYLRTQGFVGLRDTSKSGYMRRLNRIRVDHGHRTVAA